MAPAPCLGFVLVVVAAAGNYPHRDGFCSTVDDEAAVLMQVLRPKASVALIGDEALIVDPNEIFGTAEQPEPVPMSFMRTVDKTGMVRKQSSGGLVFYTYTDREDRHVSAAITSDSYWEKTASDNFCAAAQPLKGKAHILDVGANIGTWTVPLATCLKKLGHGGQVYAVEAVPTIAHHLEASVVANNLDNVHLFNYGVGNATGSLPISLDLENRGGTSFRGPNPAGSIPITTLDLILASAGIEPSRIFAMKMDIEGFEGFAMQGAKTLLRKGYGPCMIQVELLPGMAVGGEPIADFVGKLLAEAGYTLVQPGRRRVWDNIFRRVDYAKCIERLQD